MKDIKNAAPVGQIVLGPLGSRNDENRLGTPLLVHSLLGHSRTAKQEQLRPPGQEPPHLDAIRTDLEWPNLHVLDEFEEGKEMDSSACCMHKARACAHQRHA